MLKRLAINDYSSACFAVHKISNFNGNLVSKIGNFMRSMSCSNKTKILEIISLLEVPIVVKIFFKDET